MSKELFSQIYGKTGIDTDGLLTPDLEVTLDNIQKTAASACFQYLDNMHAGDLFPEVAMATGIGKGRIIHKVIEEQMKRDASSKVLVVAGTKLILVEQTNEALSNYQKESSYVEQEDVVEFERELFSLKVESFDFGGHKSLLYSPGSIDESDANVHIATIQTLQSKYKKGILNLDEYDLCIVDEVHNIGTPARNSIIRNLNKAIGFTATPFRNFGKMRSPEDYGFTIVEALSLPEAQRLRLLPPLVGMQIDTKNLVNEVPINNSGKIDYIALEKVLKQSPELRPYIVERVAPIISAEGRRYKTVVAVNFVWEAVELAELFYKKGIKAGIAVNKRAAQAVHTQKISALDSLERYSLQDSDEDSIQVLISPYVASEGFNAPFTEVLVWASPTDSPLRYTQYTGRLARRTPGKAFGVVIDCLYQTNKYRWSYNMGMWMKGEVKQLENGLLWLGSELDIEGINQLPQMQALKDETDIHDIKDRRYDDFLEVQQNDFQLTRRSYSNTFRGRSKVLFQKMKPFIDEMRDEYPHLIKSRRTDSSQNVDVFIDKEKFVNEALNAGFKLKVDLLEVQETDFPLTVSGMNTFVGDKHEIYKGLSSITEEIRVIFPEKFIWRQTSSGHIIEVFSDSSKFIELMISKGFRFKDEAI